MVTREYYQQFYDNKFDNLDKMDEFLERYKITKVQIENLDRPIIGKGIELLTQNFPRKKSSGQDGFLVNSTTHLKKN